jgi:hypothetical protein
VTTNDKLTDHARDAQQKHTEKIYDDEDGATVLACHIREAPNVAKTDGRASRGKNNA